MQVRLLARSSVSMFARGPSDINAEAPSLTHRLRLRGAQSPLTSAQSTSSWSWKKPRDVETPGQATLPGRGGGDP